ncbi:MAG TPA: hypothetical protein VJB16_05175, partial [archaeon]|nr:hypothetical protein [archaeon]
MFLEITKKLADLGDALENPGVIAVLNLPAANLCEKRAELVAEPDGTLRQACEGCITQHVRGKRPMDREEVKAVIDHFGQ